MQYITAQNTILPSSGEPEVNDSHRSDASGQALSPTLNNLEYTKRLRSHVAGVKSPRASDSAKLCSMNQSATSPNAAACSETFVCSQQTANWSR
jgi:hypothetical protein